MKYFVAICLCVLICMFWVACQAWERAPPVAPGSNHVLAPEFLREQFRLARSCDIAALNRVALHYRVLGLPGCAGSWLAFAKLRYGHNLSDSKEVMNLGNEPPERSDCLP